MWISKFGLNYVFCIGGISWYFRDWTLEIEFDGLTYATNLLFLWRNNFPALSQSLPIQNIWWKSNPTIRHCVKYLQTTKCVLLGGFWPSSLMQLSLWVQFFLKLAADSHMPVQSCKFSVKSNFSNKLYLWLILLYLCPKVLKISFCGWLYETLLSFYHVC